MVTNFSSYVVRFSDGSIDHDATVEKFSGDLIKYESEREAEMKDISAAVHALFDERLGTRMNSDYVVSQVLPRLNVQPENYSILKNKVLDFVRSQSQGKTAEDGSVENPHSVFVIGRGQGGGIARRCDIRK